MIEGAIFDLDGTLIDSMGMWMDVVKIYLRSVDREPSEDLMETIWNMSLEQAAAFCKKDYDLPFTEKEIVDGILDVISDFYIHDAKPMPNVVAFLEKLRAKGVRMSVATASDHTLVAKALERCGMLQFFTEILDCTEVGHGKDEPIIYREALKHLGTPKNKTVVFEDAAYAIETLKKDGFYAVSIFSPYETEDEKIKSLCDVRITDYAQDEEFWIFAESL